MSSDNTFNAPLSEVDPEIAAVLQNELGRQRDFLEMIASENFVPRAVLESQGSVLTNKYAEGYQRSFSVLLTPTFSLTRVQRQTLQYFTPLHSLATPSLVLSLLTVVTSRTV